MPSGCKEIHHEVELGVVIGRKGVAIKENEASDFIAGYVIALDMTARDMQAEAKKRGEPWSIAKGFDTSCPVGNFIPKESMPNVESLKIWAKVNGHVKQEGMSFNFQVSLPE